MEKCIVTRFKFRQTFKKYDGQNSAEKMTQKIKTLKNTPKMIIPNESKKNDCQKRAKHTEFSRKRSEKQVSKNCKKNVYA